MSEQQRMQSVEESAARIAVELPALRYDIRRRTRMLALLLVTTFVVGVGVTTAGLLFTRSVHCAFYRDLQPPPDETQPVGEYGRRILDDAKAAASRLHC